MRRWLGILAECRCVCKDVCRWHDHELLHQLVVLFLLILKLGILRLCLLLVILGVFKVLLEVCRLIE